MSDATAPATTPFPMQPAKPDHPALEQHILGVWEARRTFERLRERNSGGPVFSFIDGPITANNPMGVHHAWGRSLKDAYQRFHAMQGKDQRYQNGFDCQGLWVEVEVEKALQLNSKPEIEAYGLDKFSRACRDRVAEYSEVQTRQSQRLGQWMDWDNDYYTLSDTNISYIWTFLAKCHQKGWLYVGHRPMTWCPRCGTSLSQHEMLDSYKDVVHPSLHVAFPLVEDGHDGEAVVIWTTTPWTLPANVAAAVNPTATYALVERDGLNLWMAQGRVEAVFGADAVVLATRPGSELVGWKYRGPFAHLPASAGGEAPCVPGTAADREKAIAAKDDVWRVLAWDEVSLEDGTGIVHIAPGCGAEDYELGTSKGLPAVVPVDESGIFFDGFGELTGLTTHDAKDVVIGDLKQQGLLVRSGTLEHRYPSCWRCSTELIFRLVDEWFISCEEIREPMKEANRTVEWSPAFYGKRMEDWLNNMGDWCISRKRYWGLPLPFYRDPEDPEGEIFVVHSKAQLRELAVDPEAVDALPELHRPWIDDIQIRHPESGALLERVAEVGDCWLDAGIVPFATLGWKSEEIGGGLDGLYANGASEGLSGAALPSNEEWERWFPADVVLEMREQIRLWFYSMLFMSVVLDEEGRAPYKRVVAYEKVNAEDGRAMHKSWGNAIWFDDAVEKMGADVMRWLYAQQTQSQNLNFGYGPATEIKKRFLTLWNVLSFFTQYANADGWAPGAAEFSGINDGVGSAGIGLERLEPASFANPLDSWLAARTHQLVAEATTAFDRWDTPQYTRAVERWMEELSNWYVRRSRRRFWKAELGEADRDEAYAALWSALVVGARVLAPVMPFLADELWATLVTPHAAAAGDDAASIDSVHLAYWPTASEDARTHPLITEVAAVQRVLALGRAARASSKLKLRQPLRSVLVHRRPAKGDDTPERRERFLAWAEDIKAELSIRTIEFVDGAEGRWSEGMMPLLPKLGPKYGKDVAQIRKAIAAGDIDVHDDGTARVGEFTLLADEFEYRSAPVDGYALAEDADWVVVVTTTLDDELIAEGHAREVTRQLQQLRKDTGLDISDRVAVTWSADGALADAIRTHGDAIAEEVLATSFVEGDVGADVAEFTVAGLAGRVALVAQR
ncbi:MAG: isoleucyl-tRNA synthetase [Thermoleophilia bacterium]|nr:isoleucyl-tRNA synthetase [Thermoleophilia bacterium]